MLQRNLNRLVMPLIMVIMLAIFVVSATASTTCKLPSSFCCKETVFWVEQQQCYADLLCLCAPGIQFPATLVYHLRACNTGQTYLNLTLDDTENVPPGGEWHVVHGYTTGAEFPFTFYSVAPGDYCEITYTVTVSGTECEAPCGGLFNLGAASQYAVLGMNPTDASGNFVTNGTFINLSLVTVYGDVGVGALGKCSFMAPSVVNGNIYYDNAHGATASGPGKFIGSGNGFEVANLTEASNDALYVSNTAAAQTPTQTFGNIKSATDIYGNGGLNVVSIGSINLGGSSNLVLHGGAGDVFILNVTGGLDMNGSAQITGDGVNASRILINVLGTGTTLTTHVSNMINGTVLAPNRSITFHSANGAVIAGGPNITLMSGAKVCHQPFCPPCQPVCLDYTDTLDVNGAVSPSQKNAAPLSTTTCTDTITVRVPVDLE